jgi:hypothetical protein
MFTRVSYWYAFPLLHITNKSRLPAQQDIQEVTKLMEIRITRILNTHYSLYHGWLNQLLGIVIQPVVDDYRLWRVVTKDESPPRVPNYLAQLPPLSDLQACQVWTLCHPTFPPNKKNLRVPCFATIWGISMQKPSFFRKRGRCLTKNHSKNDPILLCRDECIRCLAH